MISDGKSEAPLEGDIPDHPEGEDFDVDVEVIVDVDPDRDGSFSRTYGVGGLFGSDGIFGPKGPFGPDGPFGAKGPFGPGGPFVLAVMRSSPIDERKRSGSTHRGAPRMRASRGRIRLRFSGARAMFGIENTAESSVST